MAKNCGCGDCYLLAVNNCTSSFFTRMGEFIGHNPVPVIVLNIVIFGGLGFGLMYKTNNNDIEIYFPMNSQSMKDRKVVNSLFPVKTSQFPIECIFKTKLPDSSIFAPDVLSEINSVVGGAKKLEKFTDLCIKSVPQPQICTGDGEFAITSEFTKLIEDGQVSFPLWNHQYLSRHLAGIKRNPNSGNISSASVLKIIWNMKDNDKSVMNRFLSYAAGLKLNHVDIVYSIPNSRQDELDANVKGDIFLFSLTITFICTFSSIVSWGGNPVSTRAVVAFAGIVAAGLGIVGSMGLLCILGVEFVSLTGVLPFLIFGIGVDDMFLLMSCWSENLPSDPALQDFKHVPTLLGKTMASAGVGITITSLTDFLAFLIGSFSPFLVVKNFSLNAAVAVIFCYIANATFFCACLALHGRRMYSNIHAHTCQVTKPKAELLREGKPYWYAALCGGEPARGPRDDESVCERMPSVLLSRLFTIPYVGIVIILIFMAYTGLSIYGAMHLQQGLLTRDLVNPGSYYYKYEETADEYFPKSVPVQFVILETKDYTVVGDTFIGVLGQAQNNKWMISSYRKCWLDAYKDSLFYDSSKPGDFVSSLITFLDMATTYQDDVTLNADKMTIRASRCYVLSKPNNDLTDNAQMMKAMRSIAYGSGLEMTAYFQAFVAFEQMLSVVPNTLQLVGIAIGVMTVVTFVLLPHVYMVMLVLLTIIMILTGIFGFMYFWDLTLSAVTMIHLVMSVGFSVDFSAHVCAAYLMAHPESRQDRTVDSIRHAAGPILNGAASSLVGVALLAFSKSYIFRSFVKIMVLVIGFGLLHAIFFLPAVLSLIGPVHSTPATGVSSPKARRSAGQPVDHALTDGAPGPDLRRTEPSTPL